MITQELINYVKTQVSSGVMREKITSDLLGQGGWTMEQINEAFQSAQPSVPTQIPQQEIGLEMTQAPKTIKYFEWLMYASIALSLFQLFILTKDFQLSSIFAYAPGIVFMYAPGIVFMYLVVYKRIKWARTVLAWQVLIIGFFYSWVIIILFVSYPIFYITSVFSFILLLVAIYYVFTKDSNAWLASSMASQEVVSNEVISNTKWTKVIPWINRLSTVVAVGIFLISFFGFGGFKIFDSEIRMFAIIMIVVICILVGINYFENSVLVKKYANSTSRLDTSFVILTTLRNIVLVLNVIPLIQIFGIGALVLGGVPYLITYYSMLRARNKSVITV